ncbi:sensor histidine kinase [Pararhodobacter zhoushanensis]|uniref:sensor histidine kinase n=1 Tax=Pararhodobacter zhoushanensis TaxID=2479545 RepID=UPI000F8E27F2|nr:HWE histidine kinase domain-containing protein [Pararhodobacter zhoushanensis]
MPHNDTPSSDLSFPSATPEGHRERLNASSRLTALARSELMDSMPEAVFDRAARLGSRILGVPVVLFSLVDDNRQYFKAATGLSEGLNQTPLSHSFCQYVVTAEAPLAVPDAREHPLLRDNGAVHDLDVIAYLGVPVRGNDGAVLGSFCAIDGKPHDWTAEQLSDLRDLAAGVETELALRQALADGQLLVEELHHRVKNLFTVVSGIVRMSQSAGETPATLQNRLKALSSAHALIAPAIHANRPTELGTDLQTLIETLLLPHVATQDRATLRGPEQQVGPTAATPLTLALYEMVTNAAKYGALADADARLTIGWVDDGEQLTIQWEESGLHKSSEGETGSGFGSRLLGLTVEGQLGGKLNSVWTEGTLARTIQIPLTTLQR